MASRKLSRGRTSFKHGLLLLGMRHPFLLLLVLALYDMVCCVVCCAVLCPAPAACVVLRMLPRRPSVG